MNAQFRKITDKALVSLVDPLRGYIYTCLRCSKHLKEEATAGHLCETETLMVQGVKYVRDASMRYACQLCAVAVPIVLVRAHALRHPKLPVQLEEEEWLQFSLLQTTTVSTQLAVSGETVQTELGTVQTPVIGPTDTQIAEQRGRKRSRDNSEVLLMLRKVRKVGLTLNRGARAFTRALTVTQKRAFRRWTKLLDAN